MILSFGLKLSQVMKRRNCVWTWSLLWALGSLVAGAEEFADPVLVEDSDSATGLQELIQNYRIQPSDKIQITIFQEGDLNRSVRVESDGTITLPLIGQVEVGNRTVLEVQELLYELYNRDYLVNPQVSVSVLEFRSRSVRILGQVGSPGMVGVPFDRDLTLLEAISQARGFSRLASSSRVRIRRIMEDGSVRRFTINVDEIIGDPEATDFVLQPNDTIFVPERVF